MTEAKIVFGDAARVRMMHGANALTNAVKVTLGPRGRNVLYNTALEGPQVTNDGAIVAGQIEFSDKFANMGARLLREVAAETGARTGDGTSTATILANAILLGGIRAVASDLGAIGVKRGIDLAVDTVVAHIRAAAQPISENAQIAQIATIASNGDPEIGTIIADAVAATGEHGDIFVEEGRATTDKLELFNGMWFDRGYVSRKFVTDEATLTAELRNPLILIYGKKMSTLDGLLPYLDRAIERKRPLLIIAEDVENEALTTLVVNREEGGLKVVAVKAPGFSEHRREALEDLALLTGSQVILGEDGLDLAQASPDYMGTAKKVRITVDKTTIIGGAGTAKKVQARCDQLHYTLQRTKSDQERKTLRRRIAKLTSSVAFIAAGGFSEIEIKEKKARIDKTLRAVKSAIDDGFVSGGGAALVHATKSLDGLAGTDCDEYAGIQIVRRALTQPASQIAENAGADSNGVVREIIASTDTNYGFDARSLTFGDVVDSGVIDPASVVCMALVRAASVAGPLVVTEAAVAEKKEKKMPRHPFACKCSDHDHQHYPGDPYHEHHHDHAH